MAALGSTMPELSEAQQAPGVSPSSATMPKPSESQEAPGTATPGLLGAKQEDETFLEATSLSNEVVGVLEGAPVLPEQAGASETDINTAVDPGSQVTKDNGIVDESGLAVKPSAHEIPRGNTIIVNYAPKSFTDESLAETFSPFGEVESARAIFDRKAAQCMGYGFVKFDSVESAVNAVKHYETASPDHRRIKVHFARPKQQCNIYASSLPTHYMGTDMIALFSSYGPVLEVKNLLGKDGENRGCWFVKFGDIDQTHAAVAALNETVPPGGFNRINVSLAAGTKREASTPSFPIHPPMPPTSYFSGTYGRRPPPPPAFPGAQYGDRTAPPPMQAYGYPSTAISPAVPGQYSTAPGAASVGYTPMRHQAIGRPDASPYAAASRDASAYGSAPPSYVSVPQDASSYGAAGPVVGGQTRQQRA